MESLFSLRIYGENHLDVPGGALLVVNHQSFLDPPLIGCCLKEPIYFLARHTLFKKGGLGKLITLLNGIPINRDKPDSSSLKTVIRLLKEGKKVLIFPEGTRTENGELLPAEPGVGLFIAKTKTPIIPVRIRGAFEAWPRDSFFPIPGTIEVYIGKAFEIDSSYYDAKNKINYQAVADRVMAEINNL
jgi:1-acyl-sn-glycerol-3-phosphate acyltransferase